MWSDVPLVTVKPMSGQRSRKRASVAGNSGAGIIAGDSDPQRLRRRAAARQLQDLVVDRQQPARLVDHDFAARREAHARRALVEQLIAERAPAVA